VPDEDCIKDKPTSIALSGYLMCNSLLQNFLNYFLFRKRDFRPMVAHRHW